MKTLTLYLSGRLFGAALGVTLMLAAIGQVVDLFDTADNILETGTGIGGFAFYLVMTLPTLLDQLIPIGTLIATLFVVSILARNNEATAMRAAGLSPGRVAVCLLPAAIGLALVHFAVLEGLTQPAEQHVAQWWANHLSDPGARANEPVWLKVDGNVVSVQHVEDGGRKLGGVTIFERDAQSIVGSRVVAEHAAYDAGNWHLSGAKRTAWPRETQSQTHPADGPWQTHLRPASIMEALTPQGHVSARLAEGVLSGRLPATAAPSVYRTAVQRAFAAPLANLPMLLIATPLILTNPRQTVMGRGFLVSLGAGLFYMLVDGLGATIARGGVADPVLASWGPLVVFSLFAIARLAWLTRMPRSHRPSSESLPQASEIMP
ncbi:LptF/LptG family permease [Pararhizobium mangrovi]|uniref:YjgP/YjgQ family permease n=1 Tax=Pararhizobium mangrovi TaxID=2590452 RepID=A0A506U8U5_9HYPH|nr:LptF/LptG family permease [Pararhizobium mangrovi]TPW29938.1 YjgP/YjgQ family permease [Pararhizobium mangrovi]